MIKFFLINILLLNVSFAFAFDPFIDSTEMLRLQSLVIIPDTIYQPYQLDVKPEFPSGNQAINKWLDENMNYPIVAIENQIQAKVYVNFVVRSDGRIDNVKIVRGFHNTSFHPSIENEAIRLVKSMPKWKAGQKDGKNVHSYFIIPIMFVLKNEHFLLIEEKK